MRVVTNAEMGLILMTRVGPSGTELSNADANYLLEALRRDWAVRVLDAFCRMRSADMRALWNHQTSVQDCIIRMNKTPVYSFEGVNEEAARLAAAYAVWDELPESVRAEIGERP